MLHSTGGAVVLLLCAIGCIAAARFLLRPRGSEAEQRVYVAGAFGILFGIVKLLEAVSGGR